MSIRSGRVSKRHGEFRFIYTIICLFVVQFILEVVMELCTNVSPWISILVCGVYTVTCAVCIYLLVGSRLIQIIQYPLDTSVSGTSSTTPMHPKLHPNYYHSLPIANFIPASPYDKKEAQQSQRSQRRREKRPSASSSKSTPSISTSTTSFLPSYPPPSQASPSSSRRSSTPRSLLFHAHRKPKRFSEPIDEYDIITNDPNNYFFNKTLERLNWQQQQQQQLEEEQEQQQHTQQSEPQEIQEQQHIQQSEKQEIQVQEQQPEQPEHQEQQELQEQQEQQQQSIPQEIRKESQ